MFWFFLALRYAGSYFPDQELNLHLCIGRQSLNHWTTSEAPWILLLLTTHSSRLPSRNLSLSFSQRRKSASWSFSPSHWSVTSVPPCWPQKMWLKRWVGDKPQVSAECQVFQNCYLTLRFKHGEAYTYTHTEKDLPDSPKQLSPHHPFPIAVGVSHLSRSPIHWENFQSPLLGRGGRLKVYTEHSFWLRSEAIRAKGVGFLVSKGAQAKLPLSLLPLLGKWELFLFFPLLLQAET